MKEIIVTATRTEKSTGNIPVPLTLITKKQIQQSGLQKVSEILQQSGLQLASNILGQSLQGYPNPFGTGIQLQGLDAGYTLILMDGQPMTGRNAGVLNLDRISVNNIKQIEIIRGPAASLYGADALAGVVNIITDDASNNKTNLQLSYGTNRAATASFSASVKGKKAAVQLFAARNSSNGYDLDKTIYGKTIDASENYSFSVKTTVDLSAKTSLKNTLRWFSQKQFNDYLVHTMQQPAVVKGQPVEKDWGILNEIKHQFKPTVKLLARLYATGYENNAEVYLKSNGSLFDNSFLKQLFFKNEYVLEAGKRSGRVFLSGMGADYETINSSRYAAEKTLNNVYAFAQQEIVLFKKLLVVGGLRYDKHKLYNGQLNPRIAASFKPGNTSVSFNLSYGRGFKVPDFRQQFLFFNNSLVGYTLLGANELGTGLMQLQQQGQIDALVNISPYLQHIVLLPEKSSGINAEVKWQIGKKAKLTTGFFRNDISNLIDRYTLPFTKTNGQPVFSYHNIGSVYTQGFNLALNIQPANSLMISATYQYLEAKDKDVIRQLKQQQIVKRDPVTYISTYTRMKEYGGLFNRSRHAGALQLNYTNSTKHFNAGLRAVYTGIAGYSDLNGNGILDDPREYTSGYLLPGCVIAKTFNSKILIQAGADNLLAHTDAVRLPHLSGRTYFFNTCFYLDKIFLKNKTNTVR